MNWFVEIEFEVAAAMNDETAFAFSAELGGVPLGRRRDSLGGEVGISLFADSIQEAIDSATSRVGAAAIATIGVPAFLRIDAMTQEIFERESDQPAFPDVIGYAEIARLAGVTRQTAREYAKGSAFPQPVIETAQGPLYAKSAVEAWLEKRVSRRRERLSA
ncbi:hypothetical protein SAMN04489806_2214 [Paramicrobacterium humi]|uniref:Uncharacterized protein n=1 Tax=Paramicrobacterium humi TaxID=640635 RepID=A0A1H4NJ06_9MICO|nr:hypothetical protein [Microbacterium humi]SEB95270.1 hypothetical protein SAMN04489806_2214 [Microbacterium humi]